VSVGCLGSGPRALLGTEDMLALGAGYDSRNFEKDAGFEEDEGEDGNA